MKLDIYTENRIPITPKDIQEAIEYMDWDTAVKNFILPIGKEGYGSRLDDDFVESVSKQILPKLRKHLKERGTSKEYLDACDKLIYMFKEFDY